MPNFTCLACSVKFVDGDTQREHFGTDWHRYNLKRKVSELPPLTAEEFQDRVLQARQSDLESQKDESLYCKACKKFFKTKNAHDNHLNSKKHKDCVKIFIENHTNDEDTQVEISVPAMEIIEERQKQIEEEEADLMDAESVDSDEWDDDTENPIANNDCIFCEHHSRSIVKNLKHMSIAHSFFIPDAEFCCDVFGLLSYLADKVCKDYICLWCNEKGKTFYSLKAVRCHMIEKGHTKMLHEGAALAEYAEFYDYSASYPDHDETKDIDAEIETPILEGDEYQLVLPSGNVIGHRSLLRYYKQRINPNRAVVVSKSDRKLHKVLCQYRAIGWSSAKQEEIAKRVRDIHAMKRTQQKLYAKLGIKANKFQKHYRAQVNF
ncbi:cytoplasmic 60S subunit biogenesis factor ZNF622 [Chironomus tepperi]|uniref:cytoplasmic 60S subunit biogenesis factor ZNF622 n=1 Tax=Chironomus tepperi TaxID=113505 RepID=UPI00391EF282